MVMLALIGRLQHDEHVGVVAALPAESSAHAGHERVDVGILADDLRHGLLIIHHLVERSSLGRHHL